MRSQIPVVVIFHQRVVIRSHIDVAAACQTELRIVLKLRGISCEINHFNACRCRLTNPCNRVNHHRGIASSITVHHQLIAYRVIAV
ncbi:Uncharacterised protein [Shigella sonnei]|nr:Uncharacterised protein [Shigella sonnei]